MSYDREAGGSNASQGQLAWLQLARTGCAVSASLITSWTLRLFICKMAAMTALSALGQGLPWLESPPASPITSLLAPLLGPILPQMSPSGSHPVFRCPLCSEVASPRRPPDPVDEALFSPYSHPPPLFSILLFRPARVSACHDTV